MLYDICAIDDVKIVNRSIEMYDVTVDSVDHLFVACIDRKEVIIHNCDGNHIVVLLLGFFYKFWKDLFTAKKVHIARTPIMISSRGKQIKWFYNISEAKQFKKKHTSWQHRYIKGLASLTKGEYYEIINNPTFDTVCVDNPAWFDVMMGNDVQMRKDLLKGIKPSIINDAP